MSQQDRSRRATLVVVDGDGTVRGTTDPMTIRMPWWQEVIPVTEAVPGVTVLRVLSATADHTGDMGGDITYLVEHDDTVGPPTSKLESVGRLVTPGDRRRRGNDRVAQVCAAVLRPRVGRAANHG